MFDIESTQDIIYNYNIIIMFKNTYNNYYIYIYIISLYRSMFTQSFLHNHYNHYIYIYMTYTNITCICINVQSYIRYVTLHYITLHCITLHTYCICICICVCVYVYEYVYVYVYIYMYVYMWIYMYMYCICISTYEYMYIYIYMTWHSTKAIKSSSTPGPDLVPWQPWEQAAWGRHKSVCSPSGGSGGYYCFLLGITTDHHQAVQKIAWINGSYRIAVIQHIYTYLTRDQKDAQSDFYDWAWLWLLPLGFLLFVKKYFLGPAVMNPTAESTDFLNNTAACFLDLLWWENAWRAWRCGVLQILQLQNI